MTNRARILFVAGESGVGKSTVCQSMGGHTLLLYADRITETAGPQHFRDTNECFAIWSLWTSELENPENHLRLESAFHEATLKVIDEELTNAVDLVIEGAITGHSQFRALMLRMLEREFQILCSNAEVNVFWLDPPPAEILEYIQKRGRPTDADVTLQGVQQRATRYAAMMKGQTFQRFESPADLEKAGVAFFKNDKTPNHDY